MSTFVCLNNDLNPTNERKKSTDSQDLNRLQSSKRIQDELDSNIDRNVFTFKPQLNPKTQLLASNILSFYERQNLHAKKQLIMVRFSNHIHPITNLIILEHNQNINWKKSRHICLLFFTRYLNDSEVDLRILYHVLMCHFVDVLKLT